MSSIRTLWRAAALAAAGIAFGTSLAVPAAADDAKKQYIPLAT